MDPEGVRDDLVRVWTNNLPVDDHASAKFDWFYQRAVQRPEGVFVLDAHDEGDRSRIVGTAGIAVRSFFAGALAGDRPLRAGLLADLAVDADHRHLLPALRLVRSARQTVLSDFDIAYGFPNRSAEKVFLRCGYHRLGVLTRYALILRFDSYVRRVLDWPVVSRVASAVLDVGHRAFLAAQALSVLRRYRLEWLDDVDPRFDLLWQAARRSYPLIGTRDAAFLRWRFLHHPAHRFQVVGLIDRTMWQGWRSQPGRPDRRGRPPGVSSDRSPCPPATDLRAYAVMEYVDQTAYIRDLFGHPEELGKLLDLLLLALASCGIANVSINFLGSDTLVDLLRTRGFQARPSQRTIICDARPGLGEPARLIRNIQNWHLTDADEDI